MFRPTLFVTALALFLATAQISEAEPPARWLRGPVEFGDLFPLSSPHASFAPRSPDLVRPGELEAAAVFGWSNTYLRDEQLTVDAETRELMLSLRGAPVDNIDLSLEVPILWRGGGVLDSVIDGWHRFFNLPRGKRHDVENDLFFIAGTNDDGTPFEYTDEGSELGNPAITARYGFSAPLGGKELTGALSFTLELPAGSGTATHDGVDTVTGFQLAWGGDTARLFTGAAHLFAQDTGMGGLSFEKHRAEFFAYLDYAITRGIVGSAGFYGTSGAVEGVARYPSAVVYLDVGLKFAVGASTAVELMVRENPIGEYGASDVVLCLGLRRVFSPAGIVRPALSGDTIEP